MKKAFILCLLISVWFGAFAQQTTNSYFKPVLYEYTFPQPPPVVVVDTLWSSLTGVAPYDRFFYLQVLTLTKGPKPISFGYLDYKERITKQNQAKAGQRIAQYIPLNYKDMAPAGKSQYTPHQVLVPPLSPQGHYKFIVFYAMTDQELSIVRDALFSIYKTDPAGTGPNPQIQNILNPINASKTTYGDNWLMGINYTLIYYKEKIRDKIFNLHLDDDEVLDIILNELHADIGVSEEIDPNFRPTAANPFTVAHTIPVDPFPLFFDMRSLNSVNFQPFSMDTRTGAVVAVDVGYIVTGFHPGTFFGGTTYTGVDFYFRPFDPSIPWKYVRHFRKYTHLSVLDRMSLNLGVTINSQAKTYYRANLFGNENLIGGVGYRFNNLFKLNFGMMAYYKLDPNFLIDNKKINFTPYAGVSIDIRIPSVLSSFSKLFAP